VDFWWYSVKYYTKQKAFSNEDHSQYLELISAYKDAQEGNSTRFGSFIKSGAMKYFYTASYY